LSHAVAEKALLERWKERASNKANLFYSSVFDIGHWKEEKEEDLPAYTILILVT